MNKINTEFILNYDNGDLGYVLEVDLDYPEELYDWHNAYPLAPEKLEISYEMLSDYNKEIIEEMNYDDDIKISMNKVKKLTPNLMNKTKYVCNILNLQFYLNFCTIIRKISFNKFLIINNLH